MLHLGQYFLDSQEYRISKNAGIKMTIDKKVIINTKLSSRNNVPVKKKTTIQSKKRKQIIL
jgi:hypothetical protein